MSEKLFILFSLRYFYIYLFTGICARVHVCMSVHMHVCLCMRIYLSTVCVLCMYVCMCIHAYVCMYVWVYGGQLAEVGFIKWVLGIELSWSVLTASTCCVFSEALV